MSSLNQEQQEAVALATQGHSFLLTGGAGTGKTHTLQTIINTLKGNIVICGATGLSSIVLSNGLEGEHKAVTVHSAFGLMDGRFTSGELYKLFAGEDDYYKQRRLMLAKTDVLVIDEINMVSSHTLHQVNRILQYCKGTGMVMGGVQRIFCGDFLQLPPIGNELSGDIGEPVILNDRFELYVPHKVELTQVQRTSDAILSRVIQEVSKGNVGPESMRFLESRSEQPCKTEGEKLVLYGTRDNVAKHNAEALQRHAGVSHTFFATDFGDATKGHSIVVEKKLRLKVGAPVMLIKNISDKLVNGLRGKVADLKQASVVVHFPSLNITYTFKAVDFTRCDAAGNIVFRRSQIPLVLCYATTVHESQGLTVDCAEVHVEDFYYPSLLAVAISRVKSPEGLRIVGFTRSKIIPPDAELLMRLFNHGSRHTTCTTSKLCCSLADPELQDTEFSIYCSVEEEPIDQPTSNSTNMQTCSTMNSDDVIRLLAKQIVSQPVTSIQHAMNTDVRHIQNNFDLSEIVEHFESQIISNYATTISGKIIAGTPNDTIFSEFAQHNYFYTCNDLPSRLNASLIPSKYHIYLKQLFLDMTNAYIKDKADKLAQETLDKQETELLKPSSDAGRSTLRRVGGRTVHLMRKEVLTQLKDLVADVTSDMYTQQKKLSQAIQCLVTSAAAAKQGKYPDTIKQTERRNRRGALTHITDKCFELFTAVETAAQNEHTVRNGLIEGSNVLQKSYSAILSNDGLKEKLRSALPVSLSVDSTLIEQLWRLLLKKYLPVQNNRYRLRLQTALQKTKGQALRTKVVATSQTSQDKRRKATKRKAEKLSTNDVDNECHARPCRVRQANRSRKNDWIGCSTCVDWYHVKCTELPGTITTTELEAMEWYCINCKDDDDKGQVDK